MVIVSLLLNVYLFSALAANLPPQKPLVDIKTISPSIIVDLRYATKENFLGKSVYLKGTNCLLIEDAAKMLARAEVLLQARLPGHTLVVWDCLRPRSVQKEMWAIVKGTPKARYVADPSRGSIHNYGCAVDLSVADKQGKAIDMGTDFDFFGDNAEPRHEAKLLRKGGLTGLQVSHRLLLRSVMVEAGFLTLENEWWHFDCMSLDQLKKSHGIVESF